MVTTVFDARMATPDDDDDDGIFQFRIFFVFIIFYSLYNRELPDHKRNGSATKHAARKMHRLAMLHKCCDTTSAVRYLMRTAR